MNAKKIYLIFSVIFALVSIGAFYFLTQHHSDTKDIIAFVWLGLSFAYVAWLSYKKSKK